MIVVSPFPAKEQGVLSSTVRRLPGESRELNVRYYLVALCMNGL